MPKHIPLLAASLLLFSVVPMARAADLGFTAAWERLVATSETLAAAQSVLDQARGKRAAARDLYLPEIEATANYLRLDDKVTLSPNDLLASTEGGERLAPLLDATARSSGFSMAALDAALTSTIARREQRQLALRGTWPLYAGGRIDAAQDIAAAAEKEAAEGLEAARREQFATLARLYFATALAKESLTIKEASERNLAAHLEHAIRLAEQGQIARVERLQAEAARDKARVERRKAERDLEIATLALGRLLKSDTPLSPSQVAAIDCPLPPLSEILTGTIDQGPMLAALRAKAEQAEGSITIEKGKYHPSLALFGTYNLFEEEDLTGKVMPDWLVGVGLKVPLLERSGRSGNLQAATSSLERLHHLEEQARNDLTVLVERTHRQAAQAEEEYRGLASSLALAEETVALRHKAFAQGLATSLDVVDADLFLTGVKTQRSVAAHGFLTHLALLYGGAGLIHSFLSTHEPNEAR